MSLTKVFTFKKIFYLLILSSFVISCEPESLPDNDRGNETSAELYSDTGNQTNPPETRK